MAAHADMVFNYRFQVLLQKETLFFSRISGLGMDREVEFLAEGGNAYGGSFAAGVQKNHKSLRMEGGVSKGAGSSLLSKLRPGIYLPSGIVIMVLGRDGKTDITYATGEAMVNKWEIGEFNAERGEVLLHTFEISYSYLQIQK